MKKAFSLGEVLTTLTIIGVIAALILPAFMYGTNDSSLKKSRNAISKKLGDGFGAMRVGGALGETYANTTEFVEAMKSYFNIAKVCQKNELNKCFPATVYSGANNRTSNSIASLEGDIIGLKMTDGTSMLIKYNPDGQKYDIMGGAEFQTYTDGDDTISYPAFGNLFEYVFDVNGSRKQNILGKDIIGNLPISTGTTNTDTIASSQTDTTGGTTDENTTSETTQNTQTPAVTEDPEEETNEPNCGELTKVDPGAGGIAWYFYNGEDANTAECKAKIDEFANDNFCISKGYKCLAGTGNRPVAPNAYSVMCCSTKEPCLCDNQREYNITTHNSQGGTATYTTEKTSDGKFAKIVARNKKGFSFSKWSISGKYEIVDGDLESDTIVILLKSDVSVTAYFKKGV